MKQELLRQTRHLLVVGAIGLGAVVLPVAAAAATGPYPTPLAPKVPTDPGAQVKGATAQQSTSGTSSSLPFTGSDIAGLAVIGLGATGAGIVLTRSSRRRRQGA
jgi:hypothetical protein